MAVLAGGGQFVAGVVHGARLVRGEQGQATAQSFPFVFHADFLLLGDKGRQALADVGHRLAASRRGRGRAGNQGFDVVRIQGNAGRDLDDETRGGRVVARIVSAALLARVVCVVPLRQALVADAGREQHLVVQEGHGVADGIAAQARAALQRRIVQVVAAQRASAECRLVIRNRVVDVGGERVPVVHHIGVLLLQVEEGRRHDELMTHRAGARLGAQAQFARVHAVLAGVVEAVEVAIAGAAVGQRDVAQRIGFVAAAHAEGRVGRQFVAEIMLGAHRAEPVALVRIGPRLGIVGAGVRRVGHGGDAGAQGHIGTRALELVFLPADVGGQTRIGRAPVQAQRHQAGAGVLIVDAGVAAALRGVQADAGAVVGTEAARDVGGQQELSATGHAGGDAGQRVIRRPLGHQVDHAADAAAAGRRAGQEGRRAAQHFHAFEQFGSDVLAGQQAVQAVIGHVVRAQDEAADEIRLLEIAEAARHAHAGVILQHVADAARLPVLDQLVRIAGDAERRAHVVLRAQQTDTAAARHLSAREGSGKAAGRRVGAGLDPDGVHRHHGTVGSGGLGLGRGLGVDGAKARQRRGHACKSSDFHIGTLVGAENIPRCGRQGRKIPF
ncbi:hypothetical protein D3C86_788620 [compost metagenome]